MGDIDGELAEELQKGVSAYVIAQIFRRRVLDVETLLKKKAVPVNRRGKVRLYDISEVASLFVNKDELIDSILEDIDIKDLPPKFNKDFWDGKLRKLKYRNVISQLWETQKVIEVMTRIVKTYAESMQFIPDSLGRLLDLPPSKVAMLTRYCDDLQSQTNNTNIAILESYDVRDALYAEELQEERGQEVEEGQGRSDRPRPKRNVAANELHRRKSAPDFSLDDL